MAGVSIGVRRVFYAPGITGRLDIAAMLGFGLQIRDKLLWQYPILPGAVQIYQSMVAGREWKVSGKTASSVSRAIEYLHGAVSYNYDGTIDYGFESFLKRRVLDSLCVGRTLFRAGNELEYLDPTSVTFQFNSTPPIWYDRYTGIEIPYKEVAAYHPIPLGSSGFFVAPLFSVIPRAMLAWLIKEPDAASVDGRKVRDIFIAGTEGLAETLDQAIKDSLILWSEEGGSEPSIPIAYLNLPEQGSRTVSDYVGRLGLANLPENFNRADEEFGYANEIAANTGLALRSFYNSEKATNRALEEVQEARQAQRGPSAHVRTEQRLLNNPNVLKSRFGREIRMGFIEEVDLSTQETRGKVLEAYSTALEKFALVFGGNVNGDAFLAWLQSEDILPADLELITDLGTLQVSDTLPADTTGQKGTTRKSDPPASGLTEKSIDYDEITMDSNFNVIEKRSRVFSVEKAIRVEYEKSDEFKELVDAITYPVDFGSTLTAAREKNLELYQASPLSDVEKWSEKFEETQKQKLFAIHSGDMQPDDDDHRQLFQFKQYRDSGRDTRETLDMPDAL